MIPLPKFRTLFAGLLLGLAAASSARADVSDLLFTVKIEGNANVPTISGRVVKGLGLISLTGDLLAGLRARRP